MNNVMLLYAHHADKELVDKVQGGQKSCYEVLVRRHSNALYRIARMYVFAHSEAEQLVQHTQLEAYTQLARFLSTRSYRTWLSKIMINNCLKTRKSTRQEQDDSVREPAGIPIRSAQHYDSDRLLLSQEMGGKLEACIEQLPVPLRSVYILTEIDGYSLAETAFLLDTSEDQVNMRLERAKSSLRKSLRKWFNYTEVYPLDHHSANRIVQEVMGRIDQRSDVPAGAPVF